MMSVQSNMAYFICYAHFQGNNPPWPADFGSTPCNVSDWSVDVSILNTIDLYYTIILITIHSNYVWVFAVSCNVLPAHLSYISDLCMKSTPCPNCRSRTCWTASRPRAAGRGQNEQLLVSVASVLHFNGAAIAEPQPPALRPLKTMAKNMLEPTITSCGERHRWCNKP